MELIINAPILIKVGGPLILILVVQKLTRSLSLGIAAGSLLLALWTERGIPSILAIAGHSLLALDTLMLLAVVSMVILLSNQMAESRIMSELVSAVQGRLNRRASVAVLPALIGLLPMPGGALFSAPLVDDCDRDGSIAPLQKTKANHWFRHVWEFWWPIYPGVLLAIELSGVEVWQYIVVLAPLSLFSIAGGYLFILRSIPRSHAVGSEGDRRPLLPLLAPILIVISVYGVIQLLIPRAGEASRYLPMLIGLFLAVGYLQIRRPLPLSSYTRILGSKSLGSMVLIIALISIYGAFIHSPLPDGGMLMEELRAELNTSGIPPMLLISLLPLIAGITTGISIGMIGASFPVVMSLLGPDPTTIEVMRILPYAAGFGFIGMMISPVHVCLLVTNRHFNTALGTSIQALLPNILVVTGGILLLGALWGLA